MKGQYLYGIDPGLVNTGVVLIPSGGAFANDFSFPPAENFFFFETSSNVDIGTRVKNLFTFFSNLFKTYQPSFVFIEDVDTRPFISRSSQLALWGGVVALLAALPDRSGYVLVNKVKARKILGIKKKKGSAAKDAVLSFYTNRFPQEVERVISEFGKRKSEHLLDAVLVLEAGLNLYGNKNRREE